MEHFSPSTTQVPESNSGDEARHQACLLPSKNYHYRLPPALPSLKSNATPSDTLPFGQESGGITLWRINRYSFIRLPFKTSAGRIFVFETVYVAQTGLELMTPAFGVQGSEAVTTTLLCS